MVGLRLDFTPAQSSHLRHAFTPRSPASPLESTTKRICGTKNTSGSDSASDSASSTESRTINPPSSPYKWMWYCHQCRTGYELGVTRRCLIDDHQLCYGQSIKKRSKKGSKKNRACQSEFDYTGWQNYGAWKRTQNGQDSQEEVQTERNCAAFCDWPSQCRWTRKQKQPVQTNCQEAVQAVAPHTQEECAATANEVTTQKSSDSPITIIRTAAPRLSSQWTSLLAPIEEEPASDSIESFLSLARAKTNPTAVSERADVSCKDHQMSENVPSVTPLQGAQDISNTAPTVSISDTKSNAFGLDFDFGFNRDAKEEAAPSITEGLHDLVAGTVGIALSVPSSACLERKEDSRRCVSAPPTLRSELQDQLPDWRRMSARSI
ncbi:MAG: hypothetical protein LQ343_003735 [Gyalolechia ehrenbergii]|nr:MAG: hypothetical protein LQ343_003735 [Gyalolechia ehrenbergii]